MTGEACNGQPLPCAAWRQGRTPPLQAARPAPPCCSLFPMSLICLPWPVIITVQENGKEGKMQRSPEALLRVSRALGKGREDTAGFAWPAPGPALAEGVGGHAVTSASCFTASGERRAPARAAGVRAAPASALRSGNLCAYSLS